MSRTNFHKAVYFSIVISGATALLWAIHHLHLTTFQIVLIVFILMIPGRILGFFWKDLLRGLRLLQQKQYSESKRYSELFLDTLTRRPWIKHFIWLGTSTYSRDPQSLALNNLGAAEIGLTEFIPARLHLEESILADPQNPLPYFNMGILMNLQNDTSEALSWFEKAIERGYSRSAVDKIISAAQARFAFTDGQGST